MCVSTTIDSQTQRPMTHTHSSPTAESIRALLLVLFPTKPRMPLGTLATQGFLSTQVWLRRLLTQSSEPRQEAWGTKPLTNNPNPTLVLPVCHAGTVETELHLRATKR